MFKRTKDNFLKLSKKEKLLLIFGLVPSVIIGFVCLVLIFVFVAIVSIVNFCWTSFELFLRVINDAKN